MTKTSQEQLVANRIRAKAYYYLNKEHILAKKRKWYRENLERYRGYNIEINPEKRAARRAWLRDYKETLCCMKCTENHPACLDFHHRDPSQKIFGVGSRIVHYSLDNVKKEIAKCDVLCKNCHYKLHHDLKEASYQGP